jgi:hypothetical protein
MSIATNATASAARTNHSRMTPSSIRISYAPDVSWIAPLTLAMTPWLDLTSS